MEKLIRSLIERGKRIYIGAEAIIYFVKYIDEEAILKQRIGKRYRDPVIDNILVKSRTYKEATALKIAEDLSIPTPKLFYSSIKDGVLVMSFVRGTLLRDALITGLVSEKDKKNIFLVLGNYLARLHNNNITHGDLTTSNIILTDEEEIYLIDFGLANLNSSYEEKSVDIEMFERVLISSHSDEADKLFKFFLDGYLNSVDNPGEILRRYNIIKRRGRYHVVQS